MTNLILKIFSKKSKNPSQSRERESYGKLAGFIGICTNILLAFAKVLIGLLTSSIAIIADGINNLSDASSSVITLIGFKLSEAPEDEEHPFGHARIEYITGIIISFLIIIVGFLLLQSSFEKILEPTTLTFSYITIVILVLSIIIKFWQMSFYKVVGKMIDSNTLLATSVDSRNDVIATSAVLLSLVFWKLTGINLDGITGLLVSLFIIWSGIKLIKETSSPLLGEAPDKSLVDSIIKITRSYSEVLGIHDLIIHNYGPNKIFASLHIEVDGDKDIFATHDVVDVIEGRIKSELKVECTAHLDPIKVNDPLISSLLEIVSETLLPIEGISDIHDLRIVPGPSHTKVIFDVVRAFNCNMSKKELLEIAELKVQEKHPNFYLVITFDKKYI